MIALSEYQGVADGPRRGERGRPVQPWGSYWHQKVYASPISPDGQQTRSRTDPRMGNMTPLAEWHCPPDILHPDRRQVMYPYEKTFCVARDPLARLASTVYYQMENRDCRRADAGDAASFNAHIRSRMAMQMHRGHQTFFWPQSYFTPFCDVILRFESLKRDFDGLMAKVGCPLRLPEQRKKARGNRLVPLLADDVVASVRRMYADDYALVEHLAGFDSDELLANATSA